MWGIRSREMGGVFYRPSRDCFPRRPPCCINRHVIYVIMLKLHKQQNLVDYAFVESINQGNFNFIINKITYAFDLHDKEDKNICME